MVFLLGLSSDFYLSKTILSWGIFLSWCAHAIQDHYSLGMMRDNSVISVLVNVLYRMSFLENDWVGY
jgi:hypothetical protein